VLFLLPFEFFLTLFSISCSNSTHFLSLPFIFNLFTRTTDLLAVSNLLNYFGRQDEVDKVDIAPVLLKKGNTKVALYGLGSLRDERLNRMWERQKVRFSRPEDDNEDDDDEEDQDGFFNIFTLHQNRDLGRGSKNCVQESMIPEWMDLVVWVCTCFLLFCSF